METDGLPTPDPSSFYGSDAALRRQVGAARRSLAFCVSSSLRNELRWLPAIAVRFRSSAGAERLETRVFAQRVPERIELKIGTRCAIGHFEQMRQSSDG
jgi:hypothetical protein